MTAKSEQNNELIEQGFAALKARNWMQAYLLFDKARSMDAENGYVYIGNLLIELKLREIKDLQNTDKPFLYNKNFENAVKYADEPLSEQLEAIKLEPLYRRARSLVNLITGTSHTGKENTEELEKLFDQLGGYKQTKELKSYYENYRRIVVELQPIGNIFKKEFVALKSQLSPYVFLISAFLGHLCFVLSFFFSSIQMLWIPFAVIDVLSSSVILFRLFGKVSKFAFSDLMDLEYTIECLPIGLFYYAVGCPLILMAVALAPVSSIVYFAITRKRQKIAKDAIDAYKTRHQELVTETERWAKVFCIETKTSAQLLKRMLRVIVA